MKEEEPCSAGVAALSVRNGCTSRSNQPRLAVGRVSAHSALDTWPMLVTSRTPSATKSSQSVKRLCFHRPRLGWDDLKPDLHMV